MKVVDLIRAGWLSNQIGPSRTLERIIENTAYFKEHGYDVNVFTMDLLVKRNFTASPSNAFKIYCKSKLCNLARHNIFLTRILIRRSVIRYAKQLIDYYLKQRRKADIVVFHDLFSCFYFLQKNDNKVKTVLFYHNNGAAFDSLLCYYPKLAKSGYLSRLLKMEQYILQRADKLVFIADYGRRNFLNLHPAFDFRKTVYFPNGINDLPDNGSEDQNIPFKYRLCCTGTINERKGQRLIIEALRQLNQEILKDIHVSFVGDGFLRNELERLVVSYGLSGQVSFKGAIDNSKIDTYLKQADIFILMSYEEGLPISIIEAMRAGLPVISTRVGGIPELVMEKENGFLLDPDAMQLADLLQHLEDFDWKALGYRSRQYFIQKFTFEKMMENYCNMLDSL